MISIDELNNLKTEYTEEEVIDELRKYFSEIPDITDEQIEKRVDKGKQLFFLMQLFFTMVATAELANEIQDIDYYISMISRRYSDIANETMDYIDMVSMSIVNTTFMNMDDDYTLSNDRAFQIAENEACTIENYKDFQSAVKNGAKYKTWISERDNKVRKTHKNVDDGKTIPINDYFHVGNSLMLYPHDAVNGTPNEIINCRCHVEYLKKEVNNNTENKISDNKFNDSSEFITPLNLQFFGYNFKGITGKEASEELGKETNSWIKRLTKEEKRAIRKYAFNYGDENALFKDKLFYRINAMLRGLSPIDSRLMSYVNEISNGLKKFKLEKDLVLYRRVEFNPYKDLKEKDIKRIPEFISTSIYKDKTVNKPCLITIYAPKGTRGAYIKDLSKMKNQEEFLIDMDTVVEVISNKDNAVIMRIIP